MKKGRLVTVCFALGLIILSCDTGIDLKNEIKSAQIGSISFALEKSSMPAEVDRIVVRLDRYGYPSITDSVLVQASSDSVKLTISDIPVGAWNLTVTAKDSMGGARYTGQAAVTIIDGQVVRIYITLSRVGYGSLEIIVIWGKPSKWQMPAANPVLQQSAADSDANQFYLQTPSVVKVNGTYLLWYTAGYSLSLNGKDSSWIASASSPDGITWSKRGGIDIGPSVPNWMNKGAAHPAVLYEDGVFSMWFTGMSSSTRYNAIGYATSTDGNHWTIATDPTVLAGSVRPWVIGPGIIKVSGKYFLYYSVYSASLPGSLYLVQSNDKLHWTDYGKVLEARSGVSWEMGGIFVPSLVYAQNEFMVFYTGSGNGTSAIGYAQSTDGVSWARGNQPDLRSEDVTPWHVSGVAYPSVMYENGKLRMWFSGLGDNPYQWQIGYAER